VTDGVAGAGSVVDWGVLGALLAASAGAAAVLASGAWTTLGRAAETDEACAALAGADSPALALAAPDALPDPPFSPITGALNRSDHMRTSIAPVSARPWRCW
jgi:hypothetical protein